MEVKWTVHRQRVTDLSVRLPPGFICLAEVEAQLVRNLIAQLLHNVECALAQRLAHGVKEHQDEVTQLAWEGTETSLLCSVQLARSINKCRNMKYCSHLHTQMVCVCHDEIPR